MGFTTKQLLYLQSKVSDESLKILENQLIKIEEVRERMIVELNKKVAVQAAKSLGIESILDNETQLRSFLNDQIINEVKGVKLTHKDVAEISQMHRTRITAIMNRHTRSVSTDVLIKILNALGKRITIHIN